MARGRPKKDVEDVVPLHNVGIGPDGGKWNYIRVVITFHRPLGSGTAAVAERLLYQIASLKTTMH